MTTNVPNNGIILNSYVRKLLAIFFAGLSFGVFVSGVWQGLNGTASCNSPMELPAQTKFSRTQYERLKLGMPLAAVEAILGQGIETSRNSTTVIFIWKNTDSSKITITFECEKLKSKSQSGLK
ncbi:MAG: hypothetical protein F6K10_15810 [Moorea sp. SIO2B7]|nr:hypothetical protein [Moorena sp. SIO2B7]